MIIMSKEFRKKKLADFHKANKGRLLRLGNYQSSKFKSIVLSIDGQRVELNRKEYEDYIAKLKAEKRKPVDTQKRFDPLTGEPLE